MTVEDHLIKWNLKFPLDRNHRKVHNIVFGSEEHRAVNQIDLYFQHIEDTLYANLMKSVKEEAQMEKDYKAGKWLREEKDVEGQEAEDLFARLKVENISNLKIED